VNYRRYTSRIERPVETCVIGSGGFGRSFLAQAQRTKLMRARIAVDVDAKIAADALASIGIERRRIVICATASEARSAWAANDFIAAGDLATVLELPIDVVLEATGQPEAGARHALMTIEAGHHLVLVSKEVDSVIGPGLARLAAERGRVVTPVDGDQPSLLIGLVSWAEMLGFTIVAAGKSSEYDFVFDATHARVTSNGRTVPVPNFADHWVMGNRAVDDLVAARSRIAARLPQRAVPDLCELQIAANATGYLPDRPDLHAPIARIAEVPTIFATRAEGGLLHGDGRLDVFHCLRMPDEVSFAGGVFVVVRCEDGPSWAMLAEKGHIVSRSGATAMLYLPRHLLGIEAATSVFEAAVNGASTGADAPQPHVDLVARAQADLPAGTLLTASGHHHSIADVSAELMQAKPLGAGAPVPFYLAANQRLARSVAKGALILFDDIEFASASTLLALRRRQDGAFFGPAGAGSVAARAD